MSKDIKYPDMRKELIGYLSELSDLEYQKNNWIPCDFNNGTPTSQFDYTINFLYDDTSLSDDPKSTIGWFLIDEHEANSISVVIEKIDYIFDTHGTSLTDLEYISLPEWKDLAVIASESKKHLISNNILIEEMFISDFFSCLDIDSLVNSLFRGHSFSGSKRECSFTDSGLVKVCIENDCIDVTKDTFFRCFIKEAKAFVRLNPEKESIVKEQMEKYRSDLHKLLDDE